MVRKVAITADLHLKSRNETPGQYIALENIFQKLRQENVSWLVIAGDLFDRESQNYSDFDNLCKKWPHIHILIIPGNHDNSINQKFFSTDNINVITDVECHNLEGGHLLFVPYQHATSMDEKLVEFFHREDMRETKWFLIGHGDYLTSRKEINPYEPGVYMPLSAKVVNKFNPTSVILGHIHKALERGRVAYPGSPYPLDINETGKRSFILLDVETGKIERKEVETDIIYFVESLLVLPLEDEINILKRRIEEMIKRWEVRKEELPKVRLRLILKGYTRDKSSLVKWLNEFIKEIGISYYDMAGPDMSELKTSSDFERIYILKKLQEKFSAYTFDSFLVSKEEVLEKAAEFIFGE